MQISQGEAAPRGAQHAEPCDSIEGIEDRPRKREHIENFRAIAQLFELDSTKWNCGIAERSRNGRECIPRAAEHRYAILCPVALCRFNAVEMFTNHTHDPGGLGIARGRPFIGDSFLPRGVTGASGISAPGLRHEAHVQVKGGGDSWSALASRNGGNKVDATAIVLSKAGCEGSVQLVNEIGRGAKVGAEPDRIERQRSFALDIKAGIAQAHKELGICIAEEINGLHGIADHEERAPCSIGPCGYETAKQAVLAAAGILRLVHQQVTNAIGDVDGRVTGLPVAACEYTLRDLRYLDEVDRACFSEGRNQLSDGMAQQGKACPNDCPVFFGVPRRRQAAQIAERFFETRRRRSVLR